MTFVIFILSLIVVGGLALAVETLRVNRSAPRHLTADSLAETASSSASYVPLHRLFALNDLDSLAERPDLADRLAAHRGRAMRLYLRQLRQEFMKIWSVCRLLAPVSPEPNFPALLARQFCMFHCFYTLLQLRSMVGFHAAANLDASRLLTSLNDLKAGAARLIETANPLPAANRL